MPHPSEHSDVGRPLGREEAQAMAEAMQAFATASRLRLLWALLDGEQTVDRLAELTEASGSAVSHQLRLLRHAQLVTVRREGRHAHYSLFDHHVPELLAAIRNHQEHAAPGPQLAAPVDLSAPAAPPRPR